MKKFITFLVFGVVAICGFAQTFEYKGLKYKILSEADKTCEVTENSSVSGDITIPEKVTYNNCQYTVTSIGSRAFAGCVNLSSITLPEGLTSIGSQAFEYCNSLTSITLPESLTSIGDGAFYGCYCLTSIILPETLILIGNRAFYNCWRLTSITLPENITSIGDGAFISCSSLMEINVAVENKYYASIDGVLFSKDLTRLVTFPGGKSGEYTVPNSVTSIGYSAFRYCTGLTSIILPSGLSSIEDYAFWFCFSLTSIIFPESLTSIGFGAFRYCESIASVTLPAALTSIGDSAFSNCISLTEINVAVENKNYASIDGVLFSKDLTTLLKYPGGKSGEYTVPNSVTSIGYSAFGYCAGLTSITLTENVTSIGVWAFEWCDRLSSISLPESLTSIEDGTFRYCSSLTSITLPKSLTSIGERAFEWCDRLSSITLPGDLLSMGEWAFVYCGALKTLNCYAVNPPVCGGNVISGISPVVLHVPVGTKDDYADADGWSSFHHIIDDLNEYSGVEGIDSETLEINADEVIEVYNLQGRRMNIVRRNELPSLPAGIYIVNGKKIIVK